MKFQIDAILKHLLTLTIVFWNKFSTPVVSGVQLWLPPWTHSPLHTMETHTFVLHVCRPVGPELWQGHHSLLEFRSTGEVRIPFVIWWDSRDKHSKPLVCQFHWWKLSIVLCFTYSLYYGVILQCGWLEISSCFRQLSDFRKLPQSIYSYYERI